MQSTTDLESKEAPQLPNKLDPTDLHDGKLLEEEVLDAVLKALKPESVPDGYYSKNHSIFEKIRASGKKLYSIIKENGHYYALYKGKDALLGEGGYGKVKDGQDLVTGEFVAIKIIKLEKKNDYKHSLLTHEVEALQHFGKLPSYPKPVENPRYYVTKENTNPNSPIEKIAVVMKLEKGMGLHDFCVAKKGAITDKDLLTIFMNMALAAQFIINEGYLHRDIKPNNFLIDPETLKVSLIDLGFARKLTAGVVRDLSCPHTYDVPVPKENRYYIFSEETEVYTLGYSFKRMLEKAASVSLMSLSVTQLINRMLRRSSSMALAFNDNHAGEKRKSPCLSEVIFDLNCELKERCLDKNLSNLVKEWIAMEDFKGLSAIQKLFIEYARQGDLESLEKLKQKLPDAMFQKCLVYCSDSGNNALSWAIEIALMRNAAVIQWLKKQGLHYSENDKKILYKMMVSCIELHKYKSLAILFQLYPDIDIRHISKEDDASLLIYLGESFIVYASEGKLDLLKELKKALPQEVFDQVKDSQESDSKDTALIAATINDHFSTVRWLLDAKVDVALQNDDGNTFIDAFKIHTTQKIASNNFSALKEALSSFPLPVKPLICDSDDIFILEALQKKFKELTGAGESHASQLAAFKAALPDDILPYVFPVAPAVTMQNPTGAGTEGTLFNSFSSGPISSGPSVSASVSELKMDPH